MTTIKTYAAASSAKRAAKAAVAKLNEDVLVTAAETFQDEGQYCARVFLDHAEGEVAQDQLDLLAGFDIVYEAQTEAEAKTKDEAEDEAPAADEPKKVSGYIKETSTHKGVVAQVWEIASSMPGAHRKDVIETCRQAGIAFGTARTQYQKWKAAQAK